MKKCIDCEKEVSTKYTERCRKCYRLFHVREKNHNFSHGMSETRFYKIWIDLSTRCHNNYTGRGIKNLWKSFEDFRNDMYESYLVHVKKFGEKNTTIDRIDNDGNYCKENCRWATYKEQNRNRTNNHLLTFNNEILTIAEWANKTGINQGTLNARINIYNWSIEKALTIPVIKGSNQFSKHILTYHKKGV